MKRSSAAVRLPYTPHAGQRAVHKLLERYRFVTAVCGRRWGKTKTGLEEIRRRMLARAGFVGRWTSPVYGQAKARFREAHRMLRAIEGGKWIGEVNRTDLRIVLQNESELQFWSTHDPDNVRGEGVDFFVVDEAGYTVASVWTESLRPMLSDTGGGALIIGTPRGRGQFLHLCYARGIDGEPGWASHHAPTWSSPRIAAEEIEAARRELPEDAFRQEYGAEFLDAAASVFKGIHACIRGRLEGPRPGGRYVLGVDLAKTRDFTVLTVVDVARRQVVHFERHRGMDYTRQVDLIVDTAKRYHGALVMVDETGVGKPVVDGIRAALGGSSYYDPRISRLGDIESDSIVVQGVTFTNESKADIIQKLQLDLEQQRVHFPQIPELIAELQTYSYELTKTGKVTYNAPSGFHDDTVISLGLANFALTADAVRGADPLLRAIERARNQAFGASFYPAISCGPGADPIELAELDSAELRRRYELGLITQEMYEMQRQRELPFSGWDWFHSRYS